VKRFSICIIAISFCLSACEKLKERRLTDTWLLTEWDILTDTGKVDILTTFPQIGFDAIEVEFFRNNDLTILASINGTQIDKQEGTWQESGKLDYLSFPDTNLLFDPGVEYEVLQLRRGELVLRGPCTILGVTFPECEWELDNR